MKWGDLTPLLSWDNCEKHSVSTMPSPRRVVAWALENGEEYVALLESGEGLPGRARYTIVGLGAEDSIASDDILSAFSMLRRFLEKLDCNTLPCRDMAIVLVGYEAVAEAEPWLAPKLRRHEWPILLAFKPEKLLVYDRLAERVVVCPSGTSVGSASPEDASFSVGSTVYRTPPEEFMSWVEEARRAIIDGEAFQIVLSRLERIEFRGSLFKAYLRLAELNPSPYMYYISFGGYQIIGTSPELLVKMDLERLETHPIAGTRPRARGEDDVRLEEELLADEKERAEHLMLVDLARNDLGRVAVPGTVKVTELMDIEKYSHVQHIVSRVEAIAKKNVTYAEVLEAMLPAGTVSGAPKTRAMEIIARLEDEPRGPYAGAIGVAAKYAGETAIVIRSGWLLENSLFEIRAGAGIVYDSKPEREFLETEHKLGALKSVLEVKSR